MDPEFLKLLIAFVLDDPGVTALCGDRLFTDYAPDGVATPYAYIFTVSDPDDEDNKNLDGADLGIFNEVWQLDAFSADLVESRALAYALRKRLRMITAEYPLILGDYRIISATSGQVQETTEPQEGGTDKKHFSHSLRVTIKRSDRLSQMED